MNKQGNLNEFLDVAGGSGTLAPRRRQAYTSKRLQQIVSDFRSQQARREAGDGEGDDGEEEKSKRDASRDGDALYRRPGHGGCISSQDEVQLGEVTIQSGRVSFHDVRPRALPLSAHASSGSLRATWAVSV